MQYLVQTSEIGLFSFRLISYSVGMTKKNKKVSSLKLHN